MAKTAQDVVVSFIQAINQADLPGLTSLLSPTHKVLDLGGETFKGAEIMVKGWRGYLDENPNYRIFIRQIYASGDSVILIGHTTGSHLNLPEVVEFHSEGVIWIASVKEEKIVSWQILADTLENYNRLVLDDYQLVFNPPLYAATIAKHLDLLPPGTRTQDVRNVRILYSREYKAAKPEDMLKLCEHLFFDEGYRFVPYELIFYHPGAIEALSLEQVIHLGQGIGDWSSVENYAHFIAGPAWKQGIVSDAQIEDWITSKDVWWRCASVVTTVYSGEEVNWMLQYSKKLLDDREDVIIKALSWGLRNALNRDQAAVIQFLEQNNDRLAARIKREVKHKLQTSMETPK